MRDEEDNSSPEAVLRTMFHGGNNGRVVNPKCDAPRCPRTTREGKPYCSDHVELSPYVRGVMQELALREQEAECLAIGTPIKIGGHLVRETLLMLDQGAYTSAKLSRLMDLPHDSTVTLIKLLSRSGLAEMGRTDRGALIISKVMEQRSDTHDEEE